MCGFDGARKDGKGGPIEAITAGARVLSGVKLFINTAAQMNSDTT
jgi:hypothetical protein